jgi:hypothetical protein
MKTMLAKISRRGGKMRNDEVEVEGQGRWKT